MKRNTVSLLKEVQGGILIVDGEPSLQQKIVYLLGDPAHRVEMIPSSDLNLKAKPMRWWCWTSGNPGPRGSVS